MLTTFSRFRDRPEFGEMALSDNYKEANRLMASLSAAVAMSDLTDSAVQELIEVVRTRVVATTRTKNALTSIKTREDLVNILLRNGTAQSQMEIRSLEWLEENGMFELRSNQCQLLLTFAVVRKRPMHGPHLFEA